MKRLVVYDCEIVKGIRNKNELPLPGIEYCAGWRDFENMGVSVITAHDVSNHEYRVFMADNFAEFKKLAEDPNIIMCGFNNRKFDDLLMATIGVTIEPERSWDLLREMWIASGHDPDNYAESTHGGFGLGPTALLNLGKGKSGNGALAPVLWQRGDRGAVVDYCLRDTTLTSELIGRAVILGNIKSPRTGEPLPLRSPQAPSTKP